MKTKSKRISPSARKNRNLDLFGEIPVTWDEVYLWCEVVTHGKYSLQNRNLLNYVQGYFVVDKIKAVKKQYATLEHYFVACGNKLPTAANDPAYGPRF